MDTPRTSDSRSSGELSPSPGVEPRQVYVYQRLHPDGGAAPDRTGPQRTASQRPGPRLDTVEPSSEPVLPNFNPRQATGAGRTVDDDGAGPDTPRPAAQSDAGGAGDSGTKEVKETVDTDEAEAREVQPSANATVLDEATSSAQFVHALLEANDVHFSDTAAANIPALYRECRTEGETFQSNRPNIGDLVFFHNTYDANEDGRNNNWYTLVGVIEDIHQDGTVKFVTHRGERVETHTLNLDELSQQHAGQREINSKLRTKSSDDAPFTQYLAGQLFAGFCNILGDRQELILIDEWSPE